MRPKPEDTSIRLPVTFDYKGGRSDNVKGNVLLTIILFVLSIALTIIVIRGDATPFKKVLIIAVDWFLVTAFVRFRILHEAMYSDAFETLKEVDNMPDTQSFWGIYEIEGTYPYICHFSDGKSGIFVRLEKDVIVGKDDNVMYRHFEALSDAFNLAGSLSINLCWIDYMDNVGNDSRLQGLYRNLEACDNPDMKDALLSMYSHLHDEMSHAYTTYDVFLFTCGGKDDRLWYNVNAIVDRMLMGNYLSFKALDIDGIRTTGIALLNLHEFSALDACEKLFSTQKHRGIIPISVIHADDSVTIINKTQEELRKDAQERLRALEEAKQKKKHKVRSKNKSKPIENTLNDTKTEVTSDTQSKVDAENKVDAPTDDSDLNNLFE